MSCCSNHWRSKPSAALNVCIVKVHILWVSVVLNYVCHFVFHSSLVVFVKLVLSMTRSTFLMILSSLSLSCFEIFSPQQTQLKVSTLEMEQVKHICKILRHILSYINFRKPHNRMCAFCQWCLYFISGLNRYKRTRSNSTPLITTTLGTVIFILNSISISFFLQTFNFR